MIRTLGLVPLVFALLAAATLGMAGTGTRLGWWEFGFGFGMLRIAGYTALAAAGVAAVLLLVPKTRSARRAALAIAVVVGAGVAYVPWHFVQRARAVPPIHDISTDTANPPAFAAILPLRANAPNPAEYGGKAIADQQHAGYPDLGPLDLPVPPAVAFERARDAATRMGWTIVAADSGTGRLEATATTTWFGFKDDVVVRITPLPAGSRLDVRSVSRVGRSDIGTNALRIQAFLARVAAPGSP
jgi:uncharacterized protein (DUF1499 family)